MVFSRAVRVASQGPQAMQGRTGDALCRFVCGRGLDDLGDVSRASSYADQRANHQVNADGGVGGFQLRNSGLTRAEVRTEPEHEPTPPLLAKRAMVAPTSSW